MSIVCMCNDSSLQALCRWLRARCPSASTTTVEKLVPIYIYLVWCTYLIVFVLFLVLQLRQRWRHPRRRSQRVRAGRVFRLRHFRHPRQHRRRLRHCESGFSLSAVMPRGSLKPRGPKPGTIGNVNVPLSTGYVHVE